MYHSSMQSIRGLNRSIIEKITEIERTPEEEKPAYKKQAKAWKEEMENEIETLAYLACKGQINAKDVYNLDGDFIKDTIKRFEMVQGKYPYSIELLKKWGKEEEKRKRYELIWWVSIPLSIMVWESWGLGYNMALRLKSIYVAVILQTVVLLIAGGMSLYFYGIEKQDTKIKQK